MVYTIRKSLARKRAEVYVETDKMEYCGLSKDVMMLLSEDELDMVVKEEYLVVHGRDRQWSIFAKMGETYGTKIICDY